jgi:multidrug efflux pump subunit AcrB
VLYSPLAWVIIGGLVSSTFIARLVTPVLNKLLTGPMEEEAVVSGTVVVPALG